MLAGKFVADAIFDSLLFFDFFNSPGVLFGKERLRGREGGTEGELDRGTKGSFS